MKAFAFVSSTVPAGGTKKKKKKKKTPSPLSLRLRRKTLEGRTTLRTASPRCEIQTTYRFVTEGLFRLVSAATVAVAWTFRSCGVCLRHLPGRMGFTALPRSLYLFHLGVSATYLHSPFSPLFTSGVTSRHSIPFLAFTFTQ
jgi:hypothetical protein